jgi:uncharacterized membrane protein YuzA (DUF378 family)
LRVICISINSEWIMDNAVSRRRGMLTATWVAFWLLVVGGLNWLLVGLLRFDLVAAIFGNGSVVSRLVYVLVGISAIICAATLPTGKLRSNV